MGRSGARLFTALLLLSHPAGAAPRAGELNLAGYRGAQMLRGPQNHLVLPTTVNGRAASFLLDTGADLTFLRADRAKEFGVRLLGEETRRTGRNFPLGSISGLVAGGTPLGKTTVALAEGSRFRGTAPGGGAADGVIGLDLLRRHKAVINCRTRQVFFRTDPAARLNLAATTRALGFTRIPLDQGRRGELTVPCTLRGRPGKLLVDTGAFVTGFDDDVARSLALTTQPSRLTKGGIDGRVRPLEFTRIDDLKIGGLPIAPQTFVVTDLFGERKPVRTFTGLRRLEIYAAREPGSRVFGVLGSELLDQRRAIIDLDEMALYLK